MTAQMNKPAETPYLTIDEAAARGKFCRDTIKKAIKKGGLRHMRVGRLIRINVTDFDEWMGEKIVGGIQSDTPCYVAGWTGGYDENNRDRRR